MFLSPLSLAFSERGEAGGSSTRSRRARSIRGAWSLDGVWVWRVQKLEVLHGSSACCSYCTGIS